MRKSLYKFLRYCDEKRVLTARDVLREFYGEPERLESDNPYLDKNRGLQKAREMIRRAIMNGVPLRRERHNDHYLYFYEPDT